MFAEPLHISKEVWRSLLDLELLINVVVNAISVEINDLPEWTDMDIECCELIATHQELAVSFSAHSLVDRECLLFVCCNPLFVLSSI